MKAVVLRSLGEPENLRLEDWPDPSPQAGQVLVRLRAASLNHRDVWIRIGKYPDIQLPVILGSDGAGEVVAIGEGVDPGLMGQAVLINPGLDWGDDERVQSPQYRILGMPDNGTYAQLVAVPAVNVYPKPPHLSFESAATIALASLTAYRAVAVRGRLQPGETVLVTGAGGGVSTFAVQIAKALGATVVATSRSDDKLQKLEKLGVDHTVNASFADWPSRIRKVLSGGGLDLVVDSVGGDTLSQCVELMNPAGRIVIYGATAGLPDTLNLRRIFWHQLDILGSTMGSNRDFAEMMKLYTPDGIQPVVDQVFPLDQVPQAHRRMAEAGQFGKIVLDIP